VINHCARCSQPLSEAAKGHCGDTNLPTDQCWWLYAMPEVGIDRAITLGQEIADRILPQDMVPELPDWLKSAR
jgi:hypothetical protein